MALPIAATRTTELLGLGDDAREYIRASRSENTVRSYRAGWGQFEAWCERHHRQALPGSPETVALYVTDLAGRVKPSTIDARLAAVSAAHRAAGFDSPTKSEAVRLVRRGVRRTLGTAQRQVHPISVEELRKMVDRLGDDLRGSRNRALVLLGFSAALRRSELVALDVDDIAEVPEGLRVTVRRSKSDQEGEGRVIGVPYGSHLQTCPVRAWRQWLEASGITEGPAFRPLHRGELGKSRLTDRSVANTLKRLAAKAGIAPEEVSGHSLRAGLATEAAKAGVPERVIAATTGHRGTMMLRRYIRDGNLFRENAAARVGL
jgi:site-specific recombinase XerD